VLILPAYLTNDENVYPKDRNHLLELLNKKTVERIPYNSQYYVDFDRWEKSNEEEFYKVNWDTMLHFEPYFIAPSSIPL
jgi:adenine C2-methylase RlmN of 23S rRNA A2503 and tRNA A37